MKKVKFLITLLFLLNLNCKSSSKSSFIFKNDAQKIELQIPQNKIILDGETHIKVLLTNIEPKTLTVVGVGVSVINIHKNEMNLRVKTKSEYHKDKKKFELRFRYKENDAFIRHTFYIPFKKSKNEEG